MSMDKSSPVVKTLEREVKHLDAQIAEMNGDIRERQTHIDEIKKKCETACAQRDEIARFLAGVVGPRKGEADVAAEAAALAIAPE